MDEVESWVHGELAEVLGISVDEIGAESRLEGDLGVDSIDLIEVANRAERAFGVKLEDQDIYDLELVKDLAEAISSRIAAD